MSHPSPTLSNIISRKMSCLVIMALLIKKTHHANSWKRNRRRSLLQMDGYNGSTLNIGLISCFSNFLNYLFAHKKTTVIGYMHIILHHASICSWLETSFGLSRLDTFVLLNSAWLVLVAGCWVCCPLLDIFGDDHLADVHLLGLCNLIMSQQTMTRQETFSFLICIIFHHVAHGLSFSFMCQT